MSDREVVFRAKKAVERAIEKKRINHTPVVVYDRTTGKIYNVAPDGTRTVIGTRITRGRYSERIKENNEA